MKWYHEGLQNPNRGFDPLRPRMQNRSVIGGIGIALLVGLAVGGLISRKTTERHELSSNLIMTEHQQIDEWIQANNLNKFGDPPDTVYTGGTPLLDERTGEQIDRYDYIINGHAERPWRVQ